jgi:hypothetical protein
MKTASARFATPTIKAGHGETIMGAVVTLDGYIADVNGAVGHCSTGTPTATSSGHGPKGKRSRTGPRPAEAQTFPRERFR